MLIAYPESHADSRAVFAYAQLRGKIDTNPADIKAKDFLAPIKQGHYAAMEAKDLPEFLSKLYSNEARLFISTQLALEMMLLTFVRTSELIKARWDEFDFEKKTVDHSRRAHENEPGPYRSSVKASFKNSRAIKTHKRT